MRTPAIDDYLRTIYELSQDQDRVPTSQIAEEMGVRPASVTGMVQRLAAAQPALLDYHKHRGVKLTVEGRKAALEVIRHHRLLELFLHQVLGYSWDEVHAEADRMEHVISEAFEQRIDRLLGHPTRDPHGDPIPDAALRMPASSAILLSQMRAGQSGYVLRVHDEDPQLLRHLDRLGLKPGVHVRAAATSPFDDNLTLLLEEDERELVLGPAITGRISVEVESSDFEEDNRS